MNHLRYINFNSFLKRSSSLKPSSTTITTTTQSKPLIVQKSETKPAPPTSVKKSYDIEEMKWVFNKFDTNKDGKISHQEYKAALKALGKGIEDNEISKAFQVSDVDGDGFIDLKEFIEMMSTRTDVGDNQGGVMKSTNSDIESAFKVYDLNGDGKISAEELMEVLKRIGERSSLDACKRMIRGVDSDGDGLINIDEFMVMMTRTMKVK